MSDHDDDFSAYMRARWTPLVRSLVMLGCGAQEAEDVAQSALARCYPSWGRVRRADDVDAYVFTVALNVWRKSRRRRWWGELPTSDLPEPASRGGADHAARLSIEAALGRLSPDHRAVLVLRYVADLTEGQTARVLGVPVGTVKSRTARALAAIDQDDLTEEAR